MQRFSILHLSLSDLEGGAAKAAFKTHRALVDAGHSSTMVVRSKVSEADDVRAVTPQTPWQSRRRRLRARLPGGQARLPEATATFNFDLPPDFDTGSLFRVPPDGVDVVCLHRITRFLDVHRIHAVHEHYRRPLLWVLHDQFPVTGGCHFALDCRGFTERCGRCPQLRSDDPDDLSRTTWLRKERLLKGLPLTFVAPSSDAERWVRESSLFSENGVARIPQPIDVDAFRPGSRAGAREILRVPPEAKVILLGAPDAKVPRKGGRQALEALGRLAGLVEAGAPFRREDVYLLVLGWHGDELLAAAPFAGRVLGRLEDDLTLALCYRAADVFLSASLAESGPMMVPESLLCGRPVVAFRIGCAPDLLTDAELGHLADPLDVDGLARGLLAALSAESAESAERRRRETALPYEPSRVADAYAALIASVV
jgi:glycosyltransferase involved in cell wall biosynthesis